MCVTDSLIAKSRCIAIANQTLVLSMSCKISQPGLISPEILLSPRIILLYYNFDVLNLEISLNPETRGEKDFFSLIHTHARARKIVSRTFKSL